MIKVNLLKLNNNAQLPTQARDKDFCYDVYATSCEEIEPGIWKYGLGFAFEIIRKAPRQQRVKFYDTASFYKDNHIITGYDLDNFESLVKLSLDFRPRSSVWKTGLILSNCEGTLDELYRGEVMAYFYEVVPGKEKYKVGDRIGQIKLGFTLPLEFNFVNEINMNTDRGTGGFGSTGK